MSDGHDHPTCPRCGTAVSLADLEAALPSETPLSTIDGQRGADVLTVLECAGCGVDLELAVSVSITGQGLDQDVRTSVSRIEIDSENVDRDDPDVGGGR